MFDPKILLDAILAGAAKPAAPAPQAQAGGGGGGGGADIGDILRRLGQGVGGGDRQAAPAQASGGQGGGGGLGDLLEQLGRAQQGSQAAPQRKAAAPESGGGVGDILGQIFGKFGQASGGGAPAGQSQAGPAASSGAGGAGGMGGVGDILGQIFGQAKDGVREGAGRVDEAIGARQKLDDLLRQISGGQGGAETIEKLKQMVANNQLGAGAVIGALGTLLMGTKTGRSVAVDAAKLGGLVLIGGLAYKAYQNYAAGKPVMGAHTAASAASAAPSGTGFEPEAQTNDHALLYIRAMIAAAAADGQIDRAEQQHIVGGLTEMGLGAEAADFLRQEIANPATVQELVGAATTPEAALQVYTAARLAIEPDTREEQLFLQQLATGLGVDAKLAAHIDAQATGLKV